MHIPLKKASTWIFLILTAAIAVCLTACFQKKETSSNFHMPAEWEPHDAVWLGWESTFLRHRKATLSIIKSLTPHVPVKIAVRSDSLMGVAKAFLTHQGIDTAAIQFFVHPGDRFWIRDHGAAFLLNDAGELGVADFDWNWYGEPEHCKTQNSYDPDSVKACMDLYYEDRATGYVDSLMGVEENAAIKKVRVNHEGGAIEVNGKGTLILCEATVFQRNPGVPRAALEETFKKGLGVTNIIWVKQGLADDPRGFFRRIYGNYVGGGTGGHTDEFVRFADPHTVLLAWVDESERYSNPINKINYMRMAENFEILSKAVDQDGKPFEVVRVPMPALNAKPVVALKFKSLTDTSFNVACNLFSAEERPEPGDTLMRVASSSYLNYLVTNGVVLLPTYLHTGTPPEREERVKAIFQKYFPGRQLAWIDAMPVNWGGGGIHCSTQQQPKSKRAR